MLPNEALCYAQVPSRQCTGQTACLAGWQRAKQQACPAAPSSACLQPWVMQSRSGSGTFGACPKTTSHQRMPLLSTKAADGPCALTPRWVGTESHCLSSLYSMSLRGSSVHSGSTCLLLSRGSCHAVHHIEASHHRLVSVLLLVTVTHAWL